MVKIISAEVSKPKEKRPPKPKGNEFQENKMENIQHQQKCFTHKEYLVFRKYL